MRKWTGERESYRRKVSKRGIIRAKYQKNNNHIVRDVRELARLTMRPVLTGPRCPAAPPRSLSVSEEDFDGSFFSSPELLIGPLLDMRRAPTSGPLQRHSTQVEERKATDDVVGLMYVLLVKSTALLYLFLMC